MVELSLRVGYVKKIFLALAFLLIVLAGKDIFYAGDVELTLQPYNPESGAQAGTKENPYMLSSIEDFINLQEYSKQNSCEDMYFIADPQLKENQLWFNPEDDDEEGSVNIGIQYNVDLVNAATENGIYEFVGFGSNFNYPFRGHLDMQGVILRMDTSLICHLGSGGSVDNLRIFGDITNKKMQSLYGNNTSIGAVASAVYLDKADKPVNISNIWVYSATISSLSPDNNQRSVGGICGLVFAKNGVNKGTLNLDTCSADVQINSAGRVSGNYNSTWTAGNYQNNFPGFVGGLIGDVASMYGGNSVYVNIKGYNKVAGSIVSSKSGVGGLIGHVTDTVKVVFGTEENPGTADFEYLTKLSGYNGNYYSGYLVGSAGYSLLYKASSDYEIKKPIGAYEGILDRMEEVDMDSTSSDRAAAQVYKGVNFDVDTAKIEGTGTEADPYILADANDFALLSIAYTTYGKWGLNYFEYPDEAMNKETATGASSKRVLHLRKAYYQVPNDVDISSVGIKRMNRTRDVSFYGVFEGVEQADGSYPTITMNVDSYGAIVALFAYTGAGEGQEKVIFRNFNLAGDVTGRWHVAGLIWKMYQASNASRKITSDYLFENVHIATNIRQTVYTGSYNGGFMAYAELSGCSKDIPVLTFQDVSYSGDMYVNENSNGFTGGLIGYVNNHSYSETESLVMNVNNFTLSGSLNDLYNGSTLNMGIYYGGVVANMNYRNNKKASIYDGFNNTYTLISERSKLVLNNFTCENFTINVPKRNNFLGGMISTTLSSVEAEMNNTVIRNVECNIGGTTFGGLIYNGHGFFDFNGVTFENVTVNHTISNSNTVSLMVRDFSSGIIDITGLDIQEGTCKMNTRTTWTTEIIGYNNTYFQSGTKDGITSTRVYGSIVNVNGDYSSYKGYEMQSEIRNQSNNTLMECIGNRRLHYNFFDGMTEGFIKGTGSDEDPFVIDAPEKMLVLYAFNYADPAYKDYFLKYFEGAEQNLKGTEKNVIEKKQSMIRSILYGSFVFADDLDMSGDKGYSFFPINPSGGKYYGFHAKKYLQAKGNTSPTEEEIRKACGQAITGAIPEEEAAKYKPVIFMDANRISKDNASTVKNNRCLDKSWQLAYCVANLYSGVFCNINHADVDICNLELRGNYYTNIYSNDARTGALVTCITTNNSTTLTAISDGSDVRIRHIDIGDVTVGSRITANSGSNYGAGLLVDAIYTSKVEFDYITILSGAKVKADALIGRQSATTTVSAKTVFRHMDLNAVLANDELKSQIDAGLTGTAVTAEREGYYSGGGDYGLKWGIFLYYLHSGTSIYWYEEEGMEGTEPDVMTPGLVNPDTGDRTTPNEDLLEYKKYAYKVIPVDVNPINVNITKGTGTKKDPFMIDSPGQLLTLAMCIKTEGESAEPEDWYVGNAYGDITEKYDGYDPDDNTTWNDPSNFMTKSNAVEYLRTAYYQLEKDIDFTSVQGRSMINAAEAFCGIGTEKNPFCGSLDGAGKTITLDNFGGVRTYVYGLFQYTKGIYVKDLTIEVPEPILGYNSGETNIGILAAVSRGADNVIDNVKVNATVSLNCHYSANTSSRIGGYFGAIDYGSITLAGMQKENLQNFQVLGTAGNMHSFIRQSDSYMYSQYINGIAGKLRGTYVVYSDGTAEENPDQKSSDIQLFDGLHQPSLVKSAMGAEQIVLEEIQYQNDYGIRPLLTTNIINENFLQSAGKIKVSANPDGGYYADVENEKQMYILSIAAKSGSLMASTVNTAFTHPFGKYAKTWKTEKSWVGPTLDSYAEADNIYDCRYPAIFQYFDFTDFDGEKGEGKGYLKMMGTAGWSVMNNSSANHNNLRERTTYRLRENGYYDMSTIEEFTGIGDNSLYDDTYLTANFCANFDGRNSTVKLAIDNTSVTTGGYGGLFPKVGWSQNNAGCEYKLENFTLTGSVQGSVSSGGVIGYWYSGRYQINNVDLTDFSVNSTGRYAHNGSYSVASGGLVGTVYAWKGLIPIAVNANRNKHSSTYRNVTVNGHSSGTVMGTGNNIQANNVTVENAHIIARNGHGGGIIGHSTNNHPTTTAIHNVSIDGLVLEAKKKATYNGGVAGYVEHSSAYFLMHDVEVKNLLFLEPEENSVYKGRIVGSYSKNATLTSNKELGILKFDDISITDVNTFGNYAEGDEKYKITSIYYNDFPDLEKAEEKYGIHRFAQTEEEKDLRYAELIDDKVFSTPIDLLPDNDTEDYEMVKWSSDAGSIESVLNSVLSTLTNGTGQLNDKYNDNITVNVIPMKVEGGVVSRSDQPAAINIEKRNGQFVVSNNNQYDSVEKTINGVYTPGSYSIIEVKYSIGGGTFSETIHIPFFVSNMINVDIYSKTKIGEEYSPEIMRAIRDYSSIVRVTKDSSYTVYTEFMYSPNRFEFEEDIYMYKVFRFDNMSTPVIPKYTRLTLVDVTEDQPHVYYYNVTTDLTEIPLTDFVDEDGNHYRERKISSRRELPQVSKCTTMYFNGRYFPKYNRGVEKYFMFVDCSNVAREGNINELEGQITPSIMQYDLKNNAEIFYFKERIRTILSTFNPRYINWADEQVSASTDKISKNITLKLAANISDKAAKAYWNQVHENDYNNSGKFLEVSIYLENEEGDKILFPSGTRVKLGDNENFETIKNTSNIYYYKDGADTDGFQLDDIKKDTITPVNLEIDFSYAKMENLPAGNYRVCFELVKTANKDFPMGNDTLGIIYTKLFKVISSAEYGFRFDVDSVGDLSYNIFEEGSSYTLNYKMLLNSTLPKQETADKEIEVQYTLYKKDKKTGAYEPYVGEGLVYPTLKYGAEEIALDGQIHSYEIEDIAAKDEPNNEIPFELTLTEDMEPTNYKIAATLYVNGFVEAEDYIIFQISDIHFQ